LLYNPEPLGSLIGRAYLEARSLSDLSDRREPDGRARTDFHDFEAHSPDYETKNRGNMDRYPAGAVALNKLLNNIFQQPANASVRAHQAKSNVVYGHSNHDYLFPVSSQY
jgi:hypothetical protein